MNPERIAAFKRLLNERILILDGAMGTMIQRHKLDEAAYRGERFADFAHEVKGNNDLLSLTQPDIIKTIHRQYLDAGADILETNTFNANSVSMADYHMEGLVAEINRDSARLAREVADEVLHEKGHLDIQARDFPFDFGTDFLHDFVNGLAGEWFQPHEKIPRIGLRQVPAQLGPGPSRICGHVGVFPEDGADLSQKTIRLGQ